MTSKILDNTVLSAFSKEIKSINLFYTCSKCYDLVTSIEVFNEFKIGFHEHIVKDVFKLINIIKPSNNINYTTLIDYLERRYPYLHKGELSSFLIALLEYQLESKPYYYITDDQRMKKSIKNLHQDIGFTSLFGKTFDSFRVTGTIGLIKRLKQKGLLLDKDIINLLNDLRNSTFRLTKKLIDYITA